MSTGAIQKLANQASNKTIKELVLKKNFSVMLFVLENYLAGFLSWYEFKTFCDYLGFKNKDFIITLNWVESIIPEFICRCSVPKCRMLFHRNQRELVFRRTNGGC